MLTMIVSKKEFDQIVSGEIDEIHKRIVPYFTKRFTRKFGVIGDESIVEEIAIAYADSKWKRADRKVAKCTISIGKGKRFIRRCHDIRTDEKRYILKILSLRDFDIEKDSVNDIYKDKIGDNEVLIKTFKKKEMCINKKQQGCNGKCSECEYEVSDEELKNLCKRAVYYLKDHVGNSDDYQKGYEEGRRKLYEEKDAFEGLKVPREVVNTEGFEPYCQVCRTVVGIFDRKGSRNKFCGKCGTLLDWKCVANNEDNYERLKINSNYFEWRRNYYLRRKAIEQYMDENKPMAKRGFSEEKPEEAKKSE